MSFGLRSTDGAFRQFLAVHTFIAALWRVGLQARGVAFGMVCLACVFVILWVSISASIHKNYYTPTPVRYSTPPFSTLPLFLTLLGQYWCWISPQYKGIRLGGEYIWLWIALFASLILYIPLYYWAEGRLSVDKDSWYRFHMSASDQKVEYAQRRAALGMLL